MYEERSVVDTEGTRHKLHSETAPVHATALYNAVLSQQPKTVVEVGLAYAASSLAVLAAFEELGAGTLISIDPFQNTDYSGIGLANIERAGHADRHRLIEKPSYLALPELIEEGVVVDLAYIDGMHTFDYTLVDFFLLDKMCPVGGTIAFNDCGYRAVWKVLGYVQTHRRYEALDVGLPRNFAGRNALVTTARRLTGRSREDRYFRKLEQWEPPWNFFASF